MVKKAIYAKLNSGTPARYYYDQKMIVLNTDVFPNFSKNAQKFIIWHELAHANGIKNEEQADEWAFNQLVKGDHSLKATIEATAGLLPFHTKEGQNRIIKQFNRAAKYDFTNNNNKNANIKIMETPTYEDDIYYSNFDDDNEFDNYTDVDVNNLDPYAKGLYMQAAQQDNFIGLAALPMLFGKKAKQRREERHKARMGKKDAKNELLRARAQATREGLPADSGFTKAMSSIGGAIGGILGGGGGAGAETASTPSTGAAPAPKKNNTMLYIIIGVVVLAVVYFAFIRKKKK